MGIFTMNLADGWTDRSDDVILIDGQISRWNHVWVDRQTSHATDTWRDLPC